MSLEDIILVTTVREDIRDDALQVNSDEIPRRVRAARRRATAKLKRSSEAEAVERPAKEEQHMAKTAAAKRKADAEPTKRKAVAEPAERAADEDVRRSVGKAAKRKVDVEVVKVKHAAEEVAGQR